MTEGNGFAPGFRLQDGTDLNAALANPLWSISPDVIATQGGDVNTSFRLTNTISTITTSSAPNSGVVLPQALDGKICIVNNKGANSIKIFAAGGSTIDGTAGATGVTLGAGLGYLFAATNTNEWSIFDWNGGSTTGAVIIQGGWDAGANVPALTSGVGTQGFAYIVSNAGSTNLDGTTQWNVGDWAVFDGTIWTKLAGGVNSSTATSTAVASAAALRLLPVVVGAAVTMLGYYAAGDAPARTMYGVANASPVDDGGMAFNGPTGNQWVSEAPNNGELNVLWFGAKRGINSVPADNASPAFNAAVAWIQAGSLVNGPNRPTTLFAPVGIYRLESSVACGRAGLRGEGGQSESLLNIHTQFYWYGEGFAITGVQARQFENFFLWGKDPTKYQCGFNLIAGNEMSCKNIQAWNFTGIGVQLYLSSPAISGNPLLCQIENINIVNQTTVAGCVGFRLGSDTMNNANANNQQNVMVKGKWQTLFMLGGNGNVFMAGDCEPVNDIPDRIRHWYWIGGNATKIINPYIEPSYGTPANPILPTAAHIAKFKPLYFAGYHRVVQFVAVPTAGDTLTINGTTITFVASGAVGNQCNIGASVQGTIKNLEDCITNTVDANLTKLNAQSLWGEIIFYENVSGGVTNFTVTCVSANNAFRLPPTGIPANAVWPISSGNEIDGTNWATYLYPNASAHIMDLGTSNNINVTRINNISIGKTGEKFTTRNLAPNTEFVQTYVDGSGNTLPVGYRSQFFTAGVTMTRITSDRPSGRGYAYQVFIPASARFDLQYTPGYANLPAYGNGPQAIPLDMLRNQTVTCGVWVKSSVAGLGGCLLFPGSAAAVATAAHSGNGDWEFLVCTGRILDTQPGGIQSITMKIANNQSGTADTIGGGTFLFAEPVWMFGDHVPQVHQPLLLDDTDAALTGKLTLNAPQSLLSSAGANNSTTPSVAEFNTFTEAYTSPVAVTKFLGGRAGQEITIFTTTANITFKHNANNGIVAPDTIYTATAGDVISVANRIYKFVSNGTKWYQV